MANAYDGSIGPGLVIVAIVLGDDGKQRTYRVDVPVIPFKELRDDAIATVQAQLRKRFGKKLLALTVEEDAVAVAEASRAEALRAVTAPDVNDPRSEKPFEGETEPQFEGDAVPPAKPKFGEPGFFSLAADPDAYFRGELRFTEATQKQIKRNLEEQARAIAKGLAETLEAVAAATLPCGCIRTPEHLFIAQVSPACTRSPPHQAGEPYVPDP